jgi:hypothetical protein
MNSSVNASVEAAMIAAEWRTLIPAVTMLLPNARPTTPTGHAVQMWRKKNVIGGYVRPRGSGIRVYYNSGVSVLDADVASSGGGGSEACTSGCSSAQPRKPLAVPSLLQRFGDARGYYRSWQQTRVRFRERRLWRRHFRKLNFRSWLIAAVSDL